jgi:hypothetical protein
VYNAIHKVLALTARSLLTPAPFSALQDRGPAICAGGFQVFLRSADIFSLKKEGRMLTFGLGRGISLTTLTVLLLFSPLLNYPVTLAAAPIAQPGTEGLEVIVKSTGPVQAIYQGYNSSLYSNDLYLVVDGDPAHDKFLFNNKTSPFGSTVPLGSFNAGTKLLFRLHVRDTGKDYFTGAAGRNPDGHTHARAQAEWKPNETLVSFEDLFNGPFDYNDLSFSFTPTTVGGLPPGWYRNSGAGGQSSIIYEDKSLGLKIVWENSYVYEYPGKDPLYWYTEVKYLNTGNQNLTINCVGRTEPSLAKEHMQGTANAGWVPAEDTFCHQNPNFTVSLKPGETHYEWVIFHNVPWRGGTVALEWQWQGLSRFSGWVDPWHTPFSAAPPEVCPPELETLGTCRRTVKTQIFAGYAATGSQAHPIAYKNVIATWKVSEGIHVKRDTS